MYAEEEEKEVMESPDKNVSLLFTGKGVTLSGDVFLKDKEQITLAGIDIQVIHTPGHTKGGCCYYLPQQMLLFSGDTLFHSSVGRCDLPTGSYATLVRSIKERLFVLEDEVKVLPGHGDVTTIGYEKKYNSEV